MLPGDAGITPPRFTTSSTSSAAYHGTGTGTARREHHIAAAEQIQFADVHESVTGNRRSRPPTRTPSKMPDRNSRTHAPHDGEIDETMRPATAGSQSAAARIEMTTAAPPMVN